jgi:hypothetical protein
MAKKHKWATLEEAKLAHVLATLEHTKNSITEAALLLECAPNTVTSILRRGGFEIERPPAKVTKGS